MVARLSVERVGNWSHQCFCVVESLITLLLRYDGCSNPPRRQGTSQKASTLRWVSRCHEYGRRRRMKVVPLFPLADHTHTRTCTGTHAHTHGDEHMTTMSGGEQKQRRTAKAVGRQSSAAADMHRNATEPGALANTPYNLGTADAVVDRGCRRETQAGKGGQRGGGTNLEMRRRGDK